jgi:diadenosine tetraphosphate (Ap4A) HIT family hydrolase
VAESPEQLWERVSGSLTVPPVEEWDSWPFEGDLRPKALTRPVERERARNGEGGANCHACSAADDEYVWTTERWRLRALEPTGLPLMMILEPRAHYDAPGDLPDDLAAEQGLLIARVERAVRSVEHVGRVHVGRWGEGSEHLHWWFIARPAGFEQLMSSFAEIWGDVLPPVPEEVWRANVDTVLHALET